MGRGRNLTTRGLASGVKLGDEAILHAGLTADIGYDSNVFYGSSGSAAGTKTAPILHVTPRLELTNGERDGSVPSGTYYNLSAGVDFVRYLSSEDSVTQQNAINPNVGGSAEFSSGQTLSFGISEAFSRYQQAPYQVGDPITRNDNIASASLRFAPGGGRLRVMLRYTNIIDKYEGRYDLGSNMGNEGVLDVGWRWLPRTTIYLQVAQGAITYLNSSAARPNSYPLRTLLGLRGLLTEKLAVNLAAGYSNAFYSSGNSPSGFGNVNLITELNYTISLLSRAGVGYHHDFVNSPFVGQYYNMDAIYAAYQQMVASRVSTYLFGRYENRRYDVASGRTDNYIVGGVSLDYIIRNVLLAGASYSLSLNRTNDTATTSPTRGVDYTKHILLFRLGVVY